MSLEAVIQENTNALRDLIAQLQAGQAPAAIKVAETVVQAAKESSKDPEPTTAEVKEKPKADPKPEKADDTSASEVTIDMVKKATTDLAKAKGRDAAVAVLAQFDAKNANDIKVEHYADYIAAASAAQEA